ncbi:DUF2809 domain-containing protein [Streptomyces sp. NBC_01471]|uniref:hypothetical protein n=1 Tax=Streptomyces sp. NBC_01471 TaxID=2903879 RepID=UPI003246620B
MSRRMRACGAAVVAVAAGPRPVLGTTFNAPDLFWYAVGAALCRATAAHRTG